MELPAKCAGNSRDTDFLLESSLCWQRLLNDSAAFESPSPLDVTLINSLVHQVGVRRNRFFDLSFGTSLGTTAGNGDLDPWGVHYSLSFSGSHK